MPKEKDMDSTTFDLSWSSCWNSPLDMDGFMLGSSQVLVQPQDYRTVIWLHIPSVAISENLWLRTHPNATGHSVHKEHYLL